jgi:KTSC domain
MPAAPRCTWSPSTAWTADAVRRVPVHSSAVVSVGYDAATGTLEIEYAGGGVYRYYGVPRSRVDALLAAASVGTYVTRHIKPRYPYQEMG